MEPQSAMVLELADAALQSVEQGPVGLLEKSSPNGQLQILTDLTLSQ